MKFIKGFRRSRDEREGERERKRERERERERWKRERERFKLGISSIIYKLLFVKAENIRIRNLKKN